MLPQESHTILTDLRGICLFSSAALFICGLRGRVVCRLSIGIGRFFRAAYRADALFKAVRSFFAAHAAYMLTAGSLPHMRAGLALGRERRERHKAERHACDHQACQKLSEFYHSLSPLPAAGTITAAMMILTCSICCCRPCLRTAYTVL